MSTRGLFKPLATRLGIMSRDIKTHISNAAISTARGHTIGGDPEFAVYDDSGHIVDLHELGVEGTKDSPYRSKYAFYVGGGREYFVDVVEASHIIEPSAFRSPETKCRTLKEPLKSCVEMITQVDNAALEWNLPVATFQSTAPIYPLYDVICGVSISSADPVAQTLTQMLHSLTDTIPALGKVNASLRGIKGKSPVYRITESMMSNPHVMSFGCSPDYNIYLGRENDKPSPYLLDDIRLAGGHIAVSLSDEMKAEGWVNVLVRLMDLVTLEVLSGIIRNSEVWRGCSLTDYVMHARDIGLMDQNEIDYWSEGVPDGDIIVLENLRRRFYGKAGSYRITPFGIEYRTLSPSMWVGEQFTVYSATFTALALLHYMRLSDITPTQAVDFLNDAYEIDGEDFDDIVTEHINNTHAPNLKAWAKSVNSLSDVGPGVSLQLEDYAYLQDEAEG